MRQDTTNAAPRKPDFPISGEVTNRARAFGYEIVQADLPASLPVAILPPEKTIFVNHSNDADGLAQAALTYLETGQWPEVTSPPLPTTPA